MSNKKQFPYSFYTSTAATLAVFGLVTSLYLAFSHYRNYTDITYSSFCAISQSINCDTVSQSQWSILFGIPVAIWGIFAYAFFLFTALFALKENSESKSVWDVLFVTAILFSLADIYFGYIAVCQNKSLLRFMHLHLCNQFFY